MGVNISPSGAQVSVVEGGGNSYKWLSGVPWLTSGNTMLISSSCNNVAMKSYRNSNTLLINWSEFGKSNAWFGASSVFSGIPNKASLADINSSDSPITDFQVGTNATVSPNDNARVSVAYYDPHGASSSANSDYNVDKFRVDTYGGVAGSSNVVENFSGESYRFTSNAVDSFLYNSGVSNGDADWNVNDNIAAAVGGELSLQVGYNNLIYPTRDYTGTQPAGPNYSGLSGDRTFYRLFTGTGPYNGGTIRFHGLSNALSQIQSKANIEVYLHLPGVSSYQYGSAGYENGGIFQDLGQFQNIPGGCGAFTGGSGEYVDFSFGTISSNASNYKCFIKVKIKNSSVTLNAITFTPTYA